MDKCVPGETSLHLILDFTSLNKYVIWSVHPFPSSQIISSLNPRSSARWMQFKGTTRSPWMRTAASFSPCLGVASGTTVHTSWTIATALESPSPNRNLRLLLKSSLLGMKKLDNSCAWDNCGIGIKVIIMLGMVTNHIQNAVVSCTEYQVFDSSTVPSKLPDRHPVWRLGGMWSAILRIDSLLFMDGHHILIPQDAQSSIVTLLCKSHCGLVKTYATAREHYFWPAITNNLKRAIDKCEVCQSFITMMSKEPMAQVLVNLFQEGNSHYLLLVEYYSSYSMVTRLKSFTSKTMIWWLNHWFDEYRYPWVLRSNGSLQSAVRWCILHLAKHSSEQQGGIACRTFLQVAFAQLSCITGEERVGASAAKKAWGNIPSSMKIQSIQSSVNLKKGRGTFFSMMEWASIFFLSMERSFPVDFSYWLNDNPDNAGYMVYTYKETFELQVFYYEAQNLSQWQNKKKRCVFIS